MPLKFTPHRPLIMGILNVTPDSFSGDGLLSEPNYITAALKLAEQMLKDGADLLDIGGESSRPGAEMIIAEEEMRRVIPVIEAIKKAYPETNMAVDTTKAAVAEAALKAGAVMINDISALRVDPSMAATVARHKAYIVLMHNSSHQGVTKDATIGGEYRGVPSEDIFNDIAKDLAKSLVLATKADVSSDRIILDPGIGFGKTLEQNLCLLNHIDRLKALGYPVLVGPSRKSFIGRVLDCPVDERLEGTAATVAVAALRGADIIRVHDVKFMARVARMAGAIATH